MKMRSAFLPLGLVLACGDGAVASATGASAEGSPTSDSTPDTATADSTTADATATTTAGDGPSGPCALEGMFIECTTDGMEGTAYCDEIDGELQWGPCLSPPDCMLGDTLEGCQTCTLDQGVPTIVGSATCECDGFVGVLVPCAQTMCAQRWEYQCDGCESFTDGDCFSYSQGCENPLACLLDQPPVCDRVWAQGSPSLATLEADAAAICLLESLRDGVVGTYEVLWGEMGDEGLVAQRVHAFGDGTVLVEWTHDCPGCQGFGRVGRSGALQLQPAAYFDDCLAAPTASSLIACTIGLVEFETGNPPEGYTPPFTTGECTTLEVTCG